MGKRSAKCRTEGFPDGYSGLLHYSGQIEKNPLPWVAAHGRGSDSKRLENNGLAENDRTCETTNANHKRPVSDEKPANILADTTHYKEITFPGQG